jgi:hypothetical protein
LQAEKVNKLFKIKALAAVYLPANSPDGMPRAGRERQRESATAVSITSALTIGNTRFSRIVGTQGE